MDALRMVAVVLLVWTIGFLGGMAVQIEISQQETCPVIGTHLLDNGAVLVIRECDDGTLVREYPWMGEE